jgi:hypothetical protein
LKLGILVGAAIRHTHHATSGVASMKTMLMTSDDTTQTLHITAVSFAAYLKCPTKSYLTAHGEKAPDSLVDEMRRRISVAYKTTANQVFERD